MYQPQQEAEDRYIHLMGIFTLIIVVMLFAFLFEKDNGIRYLFLKYTGTPAHAVVDEIENPPGFRKSKFIHMEFDYKNETRRFFFMVSRNDVHFKEGKIYPIVFNPLNYKISYPANLLEELRFSGKFLLIVSGLIAAMVMCIFITYKRWRTFKAKMKYY